MLHGAGKLELRGAERRARNGYRQIEKILDLGRVRGVPAVVAGVVLMKYL